MASITYSIEGMTAVVRGLEKLAAIEVTEMMRDLGALQVRNIKERVDERRSNTDGTYPASKRAQRDGGTTLIDTGAMMKSLRATKIDSFTTEVGFNSLREAQKAVWAQFGTRAFELPKGKVFPITKNGGSKQVIGWGHKKAATPPRPFFGISPADLRALNQYVKDFVAGTIRKAGLKSG